MGQPLIIREQGASVMRFNDGAALFLGDSKLVFGTTIPVVSAPPGAVYFRSDGSASNMYINTSDGTAGSVWTATCKASN